MHADIALLLKLAADLSAPPACNRLIQGCVWEKQVREKMVVYGGVLDPHACWLLQRGLATLALRVRQQTASALALAHFLEKHPQVNMVLLPWIPQ